MHTGHSGNNRGRSGRHYQGRTGGGDMGAGRPRGNGGGRNAHAARERYMNMAQDALRSGDRVLAEYYFQHADHYLRVMNEEGYVPQQQQPQQPPQQQQQHQPRHSHYGQPQDGQPYGTPAGEAPPMEENEAHPAAAESPPARDRIAPVAFLAQPIPGEE